MMKFYKTSLALTLVLYFLIGSSRAQNAYFKWIKGSNAVNAAGVYSNSDATLNTPGARYGGAMQAIGTNVYLFGGNNNGSNNRFSDLWKYETTTGNWTFIKGTQAVFTTPAINGVYTDSDPANNRPGGRSGLTATAVNGKLYIFGGQGYGATATGSGKLNDLWAFDPTSSNWTFLRGGTETAASTATSTVGTLGADDAAQNFTPGVRSAGMLATNGSVVYIFGGNGTAGNIADLWEYNPTTNKYRWLKGNTTANQNGVYSNADVSLNRPGGRQQASLLYHNNKLYLFGGIGRPETGSTDALLNDLWEFDLTTNNWTWIGGTKTGGAGTYGTLGTPSTSNIPTGRKEVTGWVVNSKLYFFGGNTAASASDGYINDFWEYDPANGNWTWLKGSNVPIAGSATSTGTFGTMGTYAENNVPPVMSNSMGTNIGNAMYLFGGTRLAAGTSNYNAMWQVEIAPSLQVLPVALKDYAAVVVNNVAKLSWSTQSEKNNMAFIISRSGDGTTFSEIKKVEGAGISTQEINYEFIDKTPLKGINYYKLSQIDTDGVVKELGVKTLRFSLSTNAVSVFPNPTKGITTLAITAGAYNSYTVLSLQGSTVAAGKVGSTATSVDIDLTSVARGTYIIKLTGTNGTSSTKVVKL